ncbi:MAG: hypothetical protein AB7V42_09290 [Thermoleophilia bacterium]
MVPRWTAAIAIGAVACLTASACSDEPSVTTAASPTPTGYVDAVQQLVGPPARLASVISDRHTHPDEDPPSRATLDGIVADARRHLSMFRSLRIDDAVIRTQRDRLAGAYARLIPRMRQAVTAVLRDEPDELVRTTAPFLSALRSLSSAASSSS